MAASDIGGAPVGDSGVSRRVALGRALVGLFLAFFLSFHVVTAVHEVLGHGLAAVWAGADLTEVYVSWTGGAGYVRWTPIEMSEVGRVLISWAGIGATVFLGGLAMAAAHLTSERAWAPVVWWTLGVCALASALGYAVLGLHYGYGDPKRTAEALADRGLLGLVVGTLIAIQCGVFWVQTRLGLRLQSRWVGWRTRWRHGALAACLLGLSAGGVWGLNVAEGATAPRQRLAVIMEPDAERRAREWLDEEIARRRARGEGELSERERQDLLGRRLEELRPWDLKWRLYVPALLASVVLGLGSGRLAPRRAVVPRVPRWLWGLALASALAAGLLSWWWNAAT